MDVKRKRAPKLDARLSTALRLAKSGGVCADIGADHGRLSAVLLHSGMAERVLVADVSEKALEKAKKRIQSLGLDGCAYFAVADGLDALEALPGRRADVIFILGMGGDTIAGILRRGRRRLLGASLVLGAQTELPLLREAVCAVGYRIRREEIAVEDGRAYVLMRCDPCGEDEPPYSEEELLLGPVLLTERPSAWQPILERREALLRGGISAMEAAALPKDRKRLERFRRELLYVRNALARF